MELLRQPTRLRIERPSLNQFLRMLSCGLIDVDRSIRVDLGVLEMCQFKIDRWVVKLSFARDLTASEPHMSCLMMKSVCFL